MYEEDKDPIEQMNKEIAQRDIEAEATRQNTIKQMEENKKEFEKKEKAQKIFDNLTSLDNRVKDIEVSISQIPQLINQSIQNAFSQLQQPQQMISSPEQLQDPAMKAQILGQLGPVAIELIKVIKGNNAPTEDYFGNMSKEITMNMLRAGVDGIMQNVYHNYNPIPPRPSWNGQQPPQPDKHRLI